MDINLEDHEMKKMISMGVFLILIIPLLLRYSGMLEMMLLGSANIYTPDGIALFKEGVTEIITTPVTQYNTKTEYFWWFLIRGLYTLSGNLIWIITSISVGLFLLRWAIKSENEFYGC